jgi:hypothetical protein
MDRDAFEKMRAGIDHEDLDNLFRDAFYLLPVPDENRIDLPCYKERIAKARAGDPVAAIRLLDHIWTGGEINPDIRAWLNECLAMIARDGVPANKAFGLTPESGRPPVVHSAYDDMCVWKEVEIIKRALGYSKLQATTELEDIYARKASTLGKMHQRGARYISEAQKIKAEKHGSP